MREGLTKAILERGMTAEGIHLAALSEMPGWSATPAELASHLGKGRRDTRRVLNRLVRAGWVCKERGETYRIVGERWPHAETDLRHLRALCLEAPERDAPEDPRE